MARSHGFGSTLRDYIALFGLAFAAALTSPRKVTRRFILQKARRHTPKEVLRLLVGTRFQVSFTPLTGCFSPFPHGTGSLSVATRI
jgi:hypothetical protein